MMKIKFKNQTIAEEVKVADGFVTRLIGLMFSKSLVGFDALLIKPCNSIHTCFMRYNIDVIFLDKNMTVVKIIREIKPWRMTWIYFKSHQVLEMAGGTLPSDINEGETLEVVCTN
ncbi:MAG: DUF192 domain-containing protein [Bacteriovoracaceae bacterium]|nr:DUF192 domain-containing protein [Bacteriovoracaceae bacterium]